MGTFVAFYWPLTYPIARFKTSIFEDSAGLETIAFVIRNLSLAVRATTDFGWLSYAILSKRGTSGLFPRMEHRLKNHG